MGLEEERQYIHELVDRVCDIDVPPMERMTASTQVQVRLRNVLIDNVLPRQIREIRGDPQKGVVTPLE